MNDVVPEPEWCIIANLLPYPYHPGPKEHLRSHKIFPAGAKLHVIGGFAGMGYETVTVVGISHRGRVVMAHIMARHLGGWRAALIYRPLILRAIQRAAQDHPVTGHRWNHRREFAFDAADYAEHLKAIADGFQQHLHGRP
ncbi:hypothetical protein [Nocardia sp. NPDC052566]|uniref:hypothetical protein n=1 Tax=Nocardia sp. NPDC052566 TaxID=3364330 RepID=UPI0037C9B206